MIVSHMAFPGIRQHGPRSFSRKRFWRLVAIREYLKWRANRRGPESITTKYRFGGVADGVFVERGRIFDPAAAVRAYRLRENRGNRDKAWIEMTRIWQLRAGMNYGRY